MVTSEKPPTILVELGGCRYALQETAKVTIPRSNGPERFIPATLINHGRDQIEKFNFEKTIAEFSSYDDVWTEKFLEVIILALPDGISASSGRQDGRTIVQIRRKHNTPPDGPYLVHSPTGNVFAVYKLMEDTENAFVGGTIPGKVAQSFRWFGNSDLVPVPSRLYSGKPTEKSPLSGLRFGVKDVIDVAGLQTGCGSKDYRSIYPAKASTAPCIRQLISKGAVLVGKLRCGQWCDFQDPLERLEEPTPINPRGDRWQKPSGSSSGSAASCASYSWLDFTVGTDTGGSIRHPAGVNGVYGIRPSLDSADTAGLACKASMETVGILARSASVAELASTAITTQDTSIVPGSTGQVKFKLLVAVEASSAGLTENPTFFSPLQRGPEARTRAGELFNDFIKNLEEFLGVARQEICLYKMVENLEEVTADVYKNVVYYELSRNVVGPFVRDYQAANEGRMPFIESKTKARLEYGVSVSDEDYTQSATALQTFAKWVNEALLPAPSTNTADVEIPILLYPQSWGKPAYRDEVSKGDGDLFNRGFSAYSISDCSGCPDFTLPVGEVPFRSKITDADGYLPVSISLLGPKGMDSVLLDLVKRLEAHRILEPVDCGPRAYSSLHRHEQTPVVTFSV